jgi:aspartyl-tRNA(Asn)/glutamyl-tRNA(Gln) amidotransferase subunit A
MNMSTMVDSWQDLGSIQRIAHHVRSGRLHPVDLAERALHHAHLATDLGAVVHLNPHQIRRDAQAVANSRQGSLAGVPVLVKETIKVSGAPHHCDPRGLADRVAASDAEVVRRARAAGAVVIGLTRSHQAGPWGTRTTGPCRNPHDPHRIAGGSNSGSAAGVAAGIAPLALGADSAGSVRITAAFCGVVGTKPSRGLLPLHGAFPLPKDLDHIGLFTSTVEDARFAVDVLASGCETRPLCGSPRLGVISNPEVMDCDPQVKDAYFKAIDQLTQAGADLVNLRMPGWSELAATVKDYGGETAVIHDDREASHTQYHPREGRERLRALARIPSPRHGVARSRAIDLAIEVDRLLSRVHAAVMPTVCITAPLVGARSADVARGRHPFSELLLLNAQVANLSGHPALTVPIPQPHLPVGLQVMAADDTLAFSACQWVESVLA